MSVPDKITSGTHSQQLSEASGWLEGAGNDPTFLAPIMLQYWQAAVRWRLLILGILAVCVTAGVIITMLQPPQFTARSQIEIGRERKNVTNVEGVVGGEADLWDREFYDTQYALLAAESLAARVARKLDLARKPDFFAANGVELDKADLDRPGSGQKEIKEREKIAADLLLGSIEISPIRNSSLVDIKYTSRDPRWSAKIANAWPKEYIGATMDREFASNADARRFLEDMLTDLRAKLEQSERDVVNFSTDRGIITLGTSRDAQGRTEEPRTLIATDLESLNDALVKARTERIAAQSRMSTKGGDSSPDAVSNSTVSELRKRRAEIAADYAQTLVRFEAGYSGSRALKAQLDSLDAAISRETNRISGSHELGYAEALSREKALEAQVEELKTRLDQQQRDSIQYNIYQRDADTNRQLYDALLQRYKDIGVAGAVGSSNIALVDEAKIPESPSSPSLPRNILIALVIGAIISTVVVLALEQLRDNIRDPGDVITRLGLPLLGSVPLTRDDPLTELGNVASTLSEAYFSIRTALDLATTHGLPRSVVVTSSQPGEGKSTTALALAISIGRTGKSVLLIDADMRSPSAHRLIGSENNAGFSNLLSGEEDYSRLIVQSNMRGVSVLPAGPNPPSAPELLGAERLTQVLTKLQTDFDHVVVDAPPVLGLADAPLLARAVEGCIFVVEAEEAHVGSIRKSLDRLRMVSGRLFGAVVTKFNSQRYGYGYGYSYNYHYSYSQSKEAEA